VEAVVGGDLEVAGGIQESMIFWSDSNFWVSRIAVSFFPVCCFVV
jgi:hypothetical protein